MLHISVIVENIRHYIGPGLNIFIRIEALTNILTTEV